jgi:hypothetical protein
MNHTNRFGRSFPRVGAFCLTTLVTSLVAAEASAAPPVKGLTVGLERAFGFVTATRSYETNNTDVTNTSVGFSLGLAGNFYELPFYNRPRLTVDYVMDWGLSFGGAVGFGIGGAETETKTDTPVGNASLTVKSPDTTMFLIAPRAGYMIGFNEHFGIWPRGGFTFVGLSWDDDDDNDDNDESASAFALSVDVPILYAMGPMGAFLAPSLDLGVGGSVDAVGDELDAATTEFGIQFGFFGVF